MGKKAKQTAAEIRNDELTFGVEEATEVLVAQYTAKVDAKIDAAREEVRAAEKADEDVREAIIDETDTDRFNHTSDTLGISSRVTDVRLDVGKTVADSNIRVVIMLTDLDIDKHYTPEFGKYRKLPMSEEDHSTLVASAAALSEVRENANRVYELRDTSSVRRQLHAEVMKAQLAKMEMSHLLESEAITAILDI